MSALSRLTATETELFLREPTTVFLTPPGAAVQSLLDATAGDWPHPPAARTFRWG